MAGRRASNTRGSSTKNVDTKSTSADAPTSTTSKNLDTTSTTTTTTTTKSTKSKNVDTTSTTSKRGSAETRDATRGPAETDVVPHNTQSLLPDLPSNEPFDIDGELEPLAESIRYILARPETAVGGHLPARIAVVSALPGEGVTTVSSGFTAVLSNDSDVKTCRVDLSWASSTKPGLFEVVMGAADLDDVLEWNGLTATLHSGAASPSERHRLARSEKLDKLINVLADRYQHVVLDLPAILSGSDGLAMMRFADTYLLVVKHGVTTLQQVQTVTHQLAGIESLGTVLNQFRTRTPRPLSRWLAG